MEPPFFDTLELPITYDLPPVRSMFLPEVVQDDRKLLVDLCDDIREPEAVLSHNGKILASAGNLSLVKAPTKHGKTFLLSIFAAAWLRGECCGIAATPNKPKILYVDSEQSKPQVYKVLKRIHQLAGLPVDRSDLRITMAYFKELNHKERLSELKKLVNDSYGLVIVDGIVDFLGDFNDLTESSLLKDELLQLVGRHDLHLITAIHTNKSDNNGRGHIGAMIEQKSETTFQLKKDSNLFEVTPAYCRHQDFEPFKFEIDETELPKLIESIPIESKTTRQRKTFQKVLATPLSYSDLVRAYSEASGLSEASAKRHISQAIYDNILKLNDLKEYLYNE
jgi:hypothetical protein